MSIAIYEGDFDDLSGGVVFSWFIFPRGPDGLRWDLSKWPTPRLVPACAATIHKSQGSGYPAVIIPVLTQHYAMLRRNLLYTGVGSWSCCRTEEGGRHRGAQRDGAEAVVEAQRVAAAKTVCLTTVRHCRHSPAGFFVERRPAERSPARA